MKSPKVILYIGAALCLGLIFSCLSLFPGVGGVYVSGAVAIGGTAAWALYRCCPWRSTAGWWILLAAATFSICGAIININYYTIAADASPAFPDIRNYDTKRIWEWTCYIVYGNPIPGQHQTTVAYVFAPLLQLFGRTIAVPILFCSLCYILTPIVIGGIAWRLTSDRRVALIAMAFTAANCFLLAQSTVLLKDTPATLTMGVTIYYIVKWATTDRAKALDMLAALIAMAVLALLRVQLMLMVAFAAIAVATGAHRQGRIANIAIAAAALIYMFVINGIILPRSTYMQIMHSVTTNKCTQFIIDYGTPFEQLFGDYTLMPFYKKLLILPLTIGLQFMLPFPWNFAKEIQFGPGECIAHFGFPWYLAGALILYWLFACMRRSPRPMQMTVLAGVLFTVATAYMTSGRIARYCLPYLPMLLPAAAYVAVNCRRKSLWIWLTVFSILLAAALLVCHHLQSDI